MYVNPFRPRKKGENGGTDDCLGARPTGRGGCQTVAAQKVLSKKSSKSPKKKSPQGGRGDSVHDASSRKGLEMGSLRSCPGPSWTPFTAVGDPGYRVSLHAHPPFLFSGNAVERAPGAFQEKPPGAALFRHIRHVHTAGIHCQGLHVIHAAGVHCEHVP